MFSIRRDYFIASLFLFMLICLIQACSTGAMKSDKYSPLERYAIGIIEKPESLRINLENALNNMGDKMVLKDKIEIPGGSIKQYVFRDSPSTGLLIILRDNEVLEASFIVPTITAAISKDDYYLSIGYSFRLLANIDVNGGWAEKAAMQEVFKKLMSVSNENLSFQSNFKKIFAEPSGDKRSIMLAIKPISKPDRMLFTGKYLDECNKRYLHAKDIKCKVFRSNGDIYVGPYKGDARQGFGQCSTKGWPEFHPCLFRMNTSAPQLCYDDLSGRNNDKWDMLCPKYYTAENPNR